MPIANTTKLIIASLTTVGVGGAIVASYYLLKPKTTKKSEPIIEDKNQTVAPTLQNNPPKAQVPSPERGDRQVVSSVSAPDVAGTIQRSDK